jgi:molecular chaperone GrpE
MPMSDDQTEAEEFEQVLADGAVAEIESLRAEVAGLKEQVLRYAADAENTKRRAEREANDARAYAIQKFARDLLGVADNLSRALLARPDVGDSSVKTFVVGVEMTEKELQQAFERNGMKKVEPTKGAKFDPNFHQAMMEQPSTEVAGGGVIQVLQPGYELYGRIVRPAMVVVAAKGSGDAAAEASTPGANPYGSDSGEEAGGAVDRKA